MIYHSSQDIGRGENEGSCRGVSGGESGLPEGWPWKGILRVAFRLNYIVESRKRVVFEREEV